MRSQQKKTILFLQNDITRYPCSRVDQKFLDTGFEVDFYWCANGEFPTESDGYAGALVYASPHGAYEDLDWIHREHALLQQLAALQTPILGICFGSQILASALCGRDQVFVRPQCEVGYLVVDRTPAHPDDALLAGLPQRIPMFIWHNDEVRAGHPDMVILGTSSACPNQIWRYRDLPIWGVQGHPELNQTEAQDFFQLHRTKLTRDGANVDALIAQANDTPEAKILVHNFIRFCSQHYENPSTQEIFVS